MHAVQRHSADMAEDAVPQIGPRLHPPRHGVGLAHRMDRAMPPGPEPAITRANAADGAPDLDDLPDFLVAEVAHRIGPARRRTFAKHAQRAVPLAIHEG